MYVHISIMYVCISLLCRCFLFPSLSVRGIPTPLRQLTDWLITLGGRPEADFQFHFPSFILFLFCDPFLSTEPQRRLALSIPFRGGGRGEGRPAVAIGASPIYVSTHLRIYVSTHASTQRIHRQPCPISLHVYLLLTTATPRSGRYLHSSIAARDREPKSAHRTGLQPVAACVRACAAFPACVFRQTDRQTDRQTVRGLGGTRRAARKHNAGWRSHGGGGGLFVLIGTRSPAALQPGPCSIPPRLRAPHLPASTQRPAGLERGAVWRLPEARPPGRVGTAPIWPCCRSSSATGKMAVPSRSASSCWSRGIHGVHRADPSLVDSRRWIGPDRPDGPHWADGRTRGMATWTPSSHHVSGRSSAGRGVGSISISSVCNPTTGAFFLFPSAAACDSDVSVHPAGCGGAVSLDATRLDGCRQCGAEDGGGRRRRRNTPSRLDVACKAAARPPRPGACRQPTDVRPPSVDDRPPRTGSGVR